MHKSDAADFCNYVVYGYVTKEDGTKEIQDLCACKDYKVAEYFTKMLAWNDKDNDPYYFTGINNPGDLVPGGGWYVSWQKGEDGKLHRSELS